MSAAWLDWVVSGAALIVAAMLTTSGAIAFARYLWASALRWFD
jgi:hypothetical protein